MEFAPLLIELVLEPNLEIVFFLLFAAEGGGVKRVIAFSGFPRIPRGVISLQESLPFGRNLPSPVLPWRDLPKWRRSAKRLQKSRLLLRKSGKSREYCLHDSIIEALRKGRARGGKRPRVGLALRLHERAWQRLIHQGQAIQNHHGDKAEEKGPHPKVVMLLAF